ncbi:MAG: 16S rRNA (cytosine(967)-C(5))-methyltransferase RsmB [Ruminococcus sp.]
MTNPRRIAFDVLFKIETDKSYSSILINQVLKENKLSKLDSSFASAIIYGVLERKLTLDYIIRSYSSVRLKKIEKKTLILLRMAVYQMLFMDKVPESAAVNETVKLAKSLKLYKSAGFINGLLRSITRAEEKYNLDNIQDKNKYLSVKYSVPQEIISLWKDSYGEEVTLDMLNSLEGRPPLYARVNTLLITKEDLLISLEKEGIKCEETPLENVIKISSTGAVELSTAFKEGKFYIQDLSSSIALESFSPKSGQTLYDVCSAPGGKSFTSAILMNDMGKINSFDLYPHKINLIKSGCKRLKINIINASVKDALKNNETETADAVICDVPCSGLGLIRRKPEIRYKEDLFDNSLKEIQYKILTASSHLVKKGGRLLYSTCTLNPDENNRMIEKFLSENEEFVGEDIILPKNIKRTVEEKPYECSLFPQTNNSDGFYFAILRRKDK